MNDNVKRLVAALRSGDYKQTTGRLRDATGFCCLGVACDLFDPTGWNEEGGYHQNIFVLSEDVRAFYGFRECNASIYTNRKNDEDSLAFRNDNGATFAEIADLIESEPPGLFVAE